MELRRRAIDRRVAAAWLAAIAVFVATRLAFLDRDLPPWDLAMYQPLDEAAYTIPAFNLHQYGTWTHQQVPWVPLEGSPMNVVQSLVTSWTLALDWSYWGFRVSSVLFALVAFVALLAIVRRLVAARREDAPGLPFPAPAIMVAAALLLLVDFSFLMGGRVVEPTIARLAEVAVLLWLVARGSLLGPTHTGRGSLAMGLLGGAGVGFGYIYNAFLLPGIVLAIVAWAWGRTSRRELVRHVVLAGAGIALALAAYFAWVYLVYGETPATWYDTWLLSFRTAGRATSFNPAGLWDLLLGNVFRLDRSFMALTLLALPVFAWWTRRSRDPLGITVLALAMAFAAQSTIQSDYPERKMLILLAFAVPIAAGGIVRAPEFLAWASAGRARVAAAAGWAILVIAGTAFVLLPSKLSHWSTLAHVIGLPPAGSMTWRTGRVGELVVVGAIVGLVALAVLLVAWRRTTVARVAGVALVAAMLLPLAAVDARYVYTGVTTTYRDTMISIEALPDAAVIAGGTAEAFQLYNDSHAVLQGNVFGMTIHEYELALVRYFAEGRARWMFSYADPPALARWQSLGFRLVQAYPIPLPKGRIMGRFEYVGPPAATP